jgi:NADPH:quinone reductase-like Zn-dependent oxidoreductase
VAGLTALRALEIGGFVVGKRVLITGASGGVGHFAVQLAAMAGAHVTGVARRAEGLAELGADEILSELTPDGEEMFDVVLDAIGGPVLGAALQRVAPRGTVVSFAATVTEPVSEPRARCCTASTSSMSSTTPGAPRPTCAGWLTSSPRDGWTRRSA